MSEAADLSTGTRYTPSAPPELVLREALAPYDAGARTSVGLREAVDGLVSSTKRALPADEASRLEPAIARITSLADTGDVSALAEHAEDIYLLRAIAQNPGEALHLLQARDFLEDARIPVSDFDLGMDLTIAREQLSFAAVVQEPGRVATMLSAVQHFQRRYAAAYIAHHERYWQEMSRLHDNLLETRPHSRALARLNSLSDLGPPVGEQAIEAIEELIRQATGCPQTTDLASGLKEAAVCPDCRLALDDMPPSTRADELKSRLRRAIERQMARLSSVAVREVLERSADPRLERFLRVIQASQLSTLVDILDDQLANYLRRYLLETRIRDVLSPLLEEVEHGGSPDPAAARDRMREVGRLVDRAAKAARRSLPPGKESERET